MKTRTFDDNSIAIEMKEKLMNIIRSMSEASGDFVVNPGKDFTRKRKLDFETIMKLILSMNGNSLNKELHDFYKDTGNFVTSSAFVQQRGKLLPEAFEYLFHQFNSLCEDKARWKGYRLLAADGTVLNIAKNPEAETYLEQGFNQLHISALYDILNKTYTDIVIQPQPKNDERGAVREIIKKRQFNEKTILIADRGYESYNLFENIKRTPNLDFLIRIRNGLTKEARSRAMCPFDLDIETELRTTNTKKDREAFRAGKAKYISGPKKRGKGKAFVTWEFESPFLMKYRLVRFEIAPGVYETIATSLPRNEVSAQEIKELYGMRWGIETSFRELKYSIGLVNLHAKKESFIKQEIFAMLTMYNFCERITMAIVILQDDKKKHIYRVNFTMAIHICREFFSYNDKAPPDISKDIRHYILPVRPGRTDKRKMKTQTAVTFLYRVA